MHCITHCNAVHIATKHKMDEYVIVPSALQTKLKLRVIVPGTFKSKHTLASVFLCYVL